MPGVSVLRRRRGFPAALLGGGLGLLFNFNWACSLIVSSWRDPSGQVLGFTLGFVLLGLGWIERDLGVDRDCGGTGGVGGAGGRRSHFARCPHLRIEIGGTRLEAGGRGTGVRSTRCVGSARGARFPVVPASFSEQGHFFRFGRCTQLPIECR
jgi:hypothetical protein